MAVEILKALDEDKVIAWDKLHDKRKVYRCERCGAEWKCEYVENTFGSSHEMNCDPDILCYCCGFPTVKEVTARETDNNGGIPLLIYYEIWNSVSEMRSECTEMCTTLDIARDHLKNDHADWCRPKGTGRIYEITLMVTVGGSIEKISKQISDETSETSERGDHDCDR